MILCFYTGLKPYVADRLLLFLYLKSFWKKISLPGELFSNFIMTEETILLIMYIDKSMYLFDWLFLHSHYTYHP